MFDMFDDMFDTHSFHGSHNDLGYEFQYGNSHVVGHDNIYDGHDFYENGVYAGHSEANIFGGQDYYDQHNQHVAHTEENGIGGMYVYSDDGFEGTYEHMQDGHDTFYGDEGMISHMDLNDVGNGSYMMDFDDPLAHIDSYIMPDLLL